VKYVARADHKGASLEDLKKAMWYLNREIHRRSLALRVLSEGEGKGSLK
jgi:hypothetical protein